MINLMNHNYLLFYVISVLPKTLVLVEYAKLIKNQQLSYFLPFFTHQGHSKIGNSVLKHQETADFLFFHLKFMVFHRFVARKISRFPPTGPAKRSTTKPTASSCRRITPLAQ